MSILLIVILLPFIFIPLDLPHFKVIPSIVILLKLSDSMMLFLSSEIVTLLFLLYPSGKYIYKFPVTLSI